MTTLPTTTPLPPSLKLFARVGLGAPMSNDQFDSNWTAIMTAFNSLLASGLPIFTFQQSADGRSLSVLNGSAVASVIQLPAANVAQRGNYTPGVAYLVDDVFQAAGSGWLVTKAFTATTFLADQAAGNFALFASAGFPGYAYKGTFNVQTPYNIGDWVSVDGSGDIWGMGSTVANGQVTEQPAAAGVTPPSAPWGWPPRGCR